MFRVSDLVRALPPGIKMTVQTGSIVRGKQQDAPAIVPLPSAKPIAPPITPPAAKPVESPIATAIVSPIAKSVETPIAKSVETPTAKQVNSPIASPVETPAKTIVQQSVPAQANLAVDSIKSPQSTAAIIASRTHDIAEIAGGPVLPDVPHGDSELVLINRNTNETPSPSRKRPASPAQDIDQSAKKKRRLLDSSVSIGGIAPRDVGKKVVSFGKAAFSPPKKVSARDSTVQIDIDLALLITEIESSIATTGLPPREEKHPELFDKMVRYYREGKLKAFREINTMVERALRIWTLLHGDYILLADRASEPQTNQPARTKYYKLNRSMVATMKMCTKFILQYKRLPTISNDHLDKRGKSCARVLAFILMWCNGRKLPNLPINFADFAELAEAIRTVEPNHALVVRYDEAKANEQ